MSVKIKGGHRVDHERTGQVFLTDDSDERVEVDRERDIYANGRAFDIPIIGGASTTAGTEEAMYVATITHQTIIAGARRFKVTQAFGA